MSKKEQREKRILNEGRFIMINKSTIRATAHAYGVCKSTVADDMRDLEEISTILFKEVRKVLEENKNQRAIRGGQSTKRYWEEGRRHQNKDTML